tara:strand:+ start:1221 stop:1556 length:336 start_codon:yes stop_codon:yes gene_type:complete
MPGTTYIKLKTEEAINAKRNILYAEMNLLNLIKSIKKYKEIKKLEFKSKLLFRAELKKLTEEFQEIKKLLPKAKEPKQKKVEIEESLGKVTKGRLELELEEIKEKLEKLET